MSSDGDSEATFYVWKKRYANLGMLEVRELRQLREENSRLKRLIAGLTLDRHMLQEVIKKDLSRQRGEMDASTIEQVDEHGSELPCFHIINRIKHATRCFGQMLSRTLC